MSSSVRQSDIIPRRIISPPQKPSCPCGLWPVDSPALSLLPCGSLFCLCQSMMPCNSHLNTQCVHTHFSRWQVSWDGSAAWASSWDWAGGTVAPWAPSSHSMEGGGSQSTCRARAALRLRWTRLLSLLPTFHGRCGAAGPSPTSGVSGVHSSHAGPHSGDRPGECPRRKPSLSRIFTSTENGCCQPRATTRKADRLLRSG